MDHEIPEPSVAARLPREVLSDIFKRSMPIPDLQAFESAALHTIPRQLLIDTPTLNPSSPPWTFGQICRYWRDVCLSEDRLWSPVAVVVGEAEILGQHSEWLLEEWLKRSGTKPLDVYFHAPRKSHTQGVQALLQILARCSLRWKSACIVVDADLVPCISGVRQHLPVLEKVHLNLLQAGDRHATVSTAVQDALEDLFEDAPKLSHVTFTGPFQLKLRLRWSQLKYYSAPAGPTMHDILGWCPNLETYRVTDGTRKRPLEGILKHLHLRTLVVWTTDGFEFLDLPALEVLWFRFTGSEVFRIITSLIDRSGCSLVKLILTDLNLQGTHQNEVEQLIASVPALKTLALSTFPVTNRSMKAVLSSLIIKKTLAPSQIPLPNLETLIVVYHRYEHDDIEDFERDEYPDLGPMDLKQTIAVLRSRLYLSPNHGQTIKPLQKVSITTSFPITGEERSVLDGMQKDGMGVETETVVPFSW